MTGVLQRSGLVRASGESPDASPASSMSIDEAYDLLGVKEEAGFDEIMSAKNRLTSASQGDKDKIVQVRQEAGEMEKLVKIISAHPQQVYWCAVSITSLAVSSKYNVAQVETAYDILLMQSMKKRLSGEGVAQNVRFADVARRKTVKQVCHTATLVWRWPRS